MRYLVSHLNSDFKAVFDESFSRQEDALDTVRGLIKMAEIGDTIAVDVEEDCPEGGPIAKSSSTPFTKKVSQKLSSLLTKMKWWQRNSVTPSTPTQDSEKNL